MMLKDLVGAYVALLLAAPWAGLMTALCLVNAVIGLVAIVLLTPLYSYCMFRVMERWSW